MLTRWDLARTEADANALVTQQVHEGVRVLGPAAAPIVRLKQDFRYHFVLKSESREKMNRLLRAMLAHAAEEKIPRTNLVVDVDALWLM